MIAIDVGDAEVSSKVIPKIEKEYDAKLAYILSTHKHWDHVDGNDYWLE